ncbi:MAG: TIGR02186 family protein, partial [Alphaproteobacteria bacterium]
MRNPRQIFEYLRIFGAMRAGITVAAVLALLQIPADAARDDALVIDLSQDLIGISTGFKGADVILFGATEGEGDVIVVVRSPSSQVIVRRKERVAGIWVNASELVFDDAPGFYHVAASAPLDDILPRPLLDTN